MTKRNPLNWPIVGDEVAARVGCEYVTRVVMGVDDIHVIYQDSRFAKDRRCSVGTWQIWCRDKKAEVIKKEKGN